VPQQNAKRRPGSAVVAILVALLFRCRIELQLVEMSASRGENVGVTEGKNCWVCVCVHLCFLTSSANTLLLAQGLALVLLLLLSLFAQLPWGRI